MSIIEETLHRLGEEQAIHPNPKPIVAGAATASTRRRSKTVPRFLLAAGGTAVVLSAVAWFVPEWIASLQGGGQFQVASSATQDKSAVTKNSGQPSPAAQPVAPVAPVVQLQPAGPEQAATTVQADSSVQNGAETPRGPQVDASAKAPETVSGQSSGPDWVADGRRLMAAGQTEQALGVWEKGFNSLDPKQRIVAVAAFFDLPSAATAWRKLASYPDAFIVSGTYRKAPAWRVVLLSQSGPGMREQDLRQTRDLIGVNGGAITMAGRIGSVAPVVKIVLEPSFDPVGRGLVPEPRLRGSGAAVAVGQEQADPVFESEAEAVVRAMNRGDYHAAIDLLKPLVERHAGRGEPWMWFGKAQMALGQPEEAEQSLIKATAVSPNRGEAWLLRGILAQERGDHVLALKMLEEAVRLAPNLPDIYFNLGYSMDALGRGLEAQNAWQVFVSLARDGARYAKQRAYVEQRLMRVSAP